MVMMEVVIEVGDQGGGRFCMQHGRLLVERGARAMMYLETAERLVTKLQAQSACVGQREQRIVIAARTWKAEEG